MHCIYCVEELRGNFCHKCGKVLENIPSKNKDQSSPSRETFKKIVNKKSSERVATNRKQGKEGKDNVMINIALMHLHEGEVKPQRGSYNKILVPYNATPFMIKRIGFEKLSRYNPEFVEGHNEFDYKLVYKNRKIVSKIPGTEIPFTLSEYKSDIGLPHSRITLYLELYDIDEDFESCLYSAEDVPSASICLNNSNNNTSTGVVALPKQTTSNNDNTMNCNIMSTCSSSHSNSSSIIDVVTHIPERSSSPIMNNSSISSNTSLSLEPPPVSSCCSPISNIENVTASQPKRKICQCGSNYVGDDCVSCRESMVHNLLINSPSIEEIRERRLHALGVIERQPVHMQDDCTSEDEVIVTRKVSLHRVKLPQELLKLFMDETILDYELQITMIDPMGKEEKGKGVGVSREAFCTFFNEIKHSHMVGYGSQKVPNIRHDMNKDSWKSLARILIYSMRLNYYPLYLSETFMIASLFGEESLNETWLLSSFKNYISVEEKDIVEQMFNEFVPNDEKLLDLLSSYNCYRLPSAESFKEIILEIAHQELIQKPRYISNAFFEVFSGEAMIKQFSTADALKKFYIDKTPTSLRVIKILDVCNLTDNQRRIHEYLKPYVKSLDNKDLLLFLRLVTGGDILPDFINVEFSSGLVPVMPRIRTCVPLLQVPEEFTSYNELNENFSSILRSPESFMFHFI